MIKIKNTDVCGWEAAIRGCRNPMNSWEQSDSWFYDNYYETYHKITGEEEDFVPDHNDTEFVGKKDLDLMKRLVKAGSDHSKFMRMITVTCDITAPLYWWKEFDTYKVGTVRNSCSTMHKIHAKPFTLDDFSYEHLIDSQESWLGFMEQLIEALNCARELFVETKDKKYWWQMIQLLPSSYNQRATVQMNYAVLSNMYHGRKHHKLDEWSVEFCKWVKTLPYSELITGESDE